MKVNTWGNKTDRCLETSQFQSLGKCSLEFELQDDMDRRGADGQCHYRHPLKRDVWTDKDTLQTELHIPTS